MLLKTSLGTLAGGNSNSSNSLRSGPRETAPKALDILAICDNVEDGFAPKEEIGGDKALTASAVIKGEECSPKSISSSSSITSGMSNEAASVMSTGAAKRA